MQNNSVPDSVLGVGTVIGTMTLGVGEGVDAAMEYTTSRDYDTLSNKVHLSRLENTLKYITTYFRLTCSNQRAWS